MQQVYNFNTLPIFYFREIADKGDVSLLYFGSEELTNKQRTELHGIWIQIFYEYIDAMDDDSIKSNYDSYLEILKMKLEHELIESARGMFLLAESKEQQEQMMAIMHRYGYELEVGYDTASQLQYIVNDLKIRKTLIAQEELIFQHKFQKDRVQVKSNIFREAVILEKITGKNDIDVMKTVCPKWIELVKLAKEQSEQRKS